ncbi:hypothetical protein ACFL7M_01030 [Thermodesulfobacteriota bacterium]
MVIDRKTINNLHNNLSQKSRARLKRAVKLIIKAKEKGGKVVAVLGSGPNLHEGVTTLVAELMHKGIIDGVLTSSAVINHEMAGTLEKVKRLDGESLGFKRAKLPSDGYFEVSIVSEARLEQFKRVVSIDTALYRRMRRAKGDIIIKVAGNVAYPSGLYTERVARDVLALSKRYGVPFELIAGLGADRLTMIGAGAERNIPVLVTVPQLIGGGEVGLFVGDSLPVSERCYRIARLLDSADVVIESAIALSQEIHDGPFERFTGHGIWTDWEGGWTYSLSDKKIVRIDLDPNLEKVWIGERRSQSVTNAVHKGLPKTKSFRIPFRMEMSGFARIPGSLPIVGDIGEIWPLLVSMVTDALDVSLDFMCYKQSSLAGKKVREWIVKQVRPIDRELMLKSAGELDTFS